MTTEKAREQCTCPHRRFTHSNCAADGTYAGFGAGRCMMCPCERFELAPPAPPPPVDRAAVTTLHGTPVEKVREQHAAEPTGMHADYIVLTAEERAKGYVRPIRRSYRHVGAPGPTYELRDLTPDESARYDRFGYVKFEAYPKSETSAVNGRYWTQAQLDSIGKGCGSVTTMGPALAETYARDPGFYGATFCVSCGVHKPVGPAGEFVWEGTEERVGT